MTLDTKRASQIIAAALILTVATQIIYMALGASGNSHIAYPIWRAEALAGLVIAVLGFVIASRNRLVGGALVVGGMLNLIQTALGLTLFYQLGYGGDTPPEPAFFAVLGLSFFLYFAAKVAIGAAGIALGKALWNSGSGSASGAAKAIGGLAMLTGIAALLINAAAMVVGMDIVFPAGAAGTAATLFAAIALLMVKQEGEASS